MEAAESLFQCLEQAPDPRKARGVRHPFQAIPPFSRGQALRLTLLGLVCGQTTMAHIALFARMHWPELKEPLEFHREHPPHATIISRTLAGVSYEQLQGALTGWVPMWWRSSNSVPRWTASGPSSPRTATGILW